MGWNAIGIARGFSGDDEQMDEMLEKAYRKGRKDMREEMEGGRYGERGGYSGSGRAGYGMREPWKEDDDDDDDEDEHEHHHHHDEDDDHGHECCHHHHDHDDDDDQDEHEHHHHHHDGQECDDPACSCHHHHHHADEVFTSWGAETPKQFTQADIDRILTALDSGEYGAILRAKGIVPAADGQWLHFDYVPQEHEVRYGAADYTGRLCVIGSQLKEDGLKTLFGL